MKGCTKIVAFAASVLVTAMPAWGQQKKGSPEDEAAIRRVLEALPETLSRRDAKRFGALFSDDAEYVGPSRSLSGRAAIERSMNTFFSPNLFRWVFEPTKSSICFARPDGAIVRSVFRLRSAGYGRESLTFRATTVLTKQGDRWRITSLSVDPPETDAGLTILVKSGSDRELRTAQQLLGLARTYDLSKWHFTRKVLIQENVPAHSHPLLTLHAGAGAGWRAGGVETDLQLARLLSVYVHEQIHRSLHDWPERWERTQQAMAELEELFPDPPIGRGGSKVSTYEHLIVFYLQKDAMKELVGDDMARRVWESFSFLAWVRQTISTERTKIQAVIEKFDLEDYPPTSTLVSPYVEITGPLGDGPFDPGKPVLLSAKAWATVGARIQRVEFLVDDMPIGVDTEAPYESSGPKREKVGM